MYKLTDSKKKNYQKQLEREFPDLEAGKIEELINYLFYLATWEANVIKQSYDKS